MNPAHSIIETESVRPVVCVFCGASEGTSPAHVQAARTLAQAMWKRNMRLVYGGSPFGLMGEIARTLVALSGPESVHGIIPEPLKALEQGDNMSYDAYGRMTVVSDMHTRKRKMADEVIAGGAGSGFVALSGGYGTLDELMEMVTWNQLGIHDRPVVVMNVQGYWDSLMEWVAKAAHEGFVKAGNESILVQAKDADDVLDCLNKYQRASARFTLSWTVSIDQT